jgi:AcrR family transcriptional regulator
MMNTMPSHEGKRSYHSPIRLRQAEETRQLILSAARRLFASSGYACTTLEAITEAAGVSPKTVSAVIGSKRAMLAELVNPDACSTQVQRLLEQLRSAEQPQQRMSLVAQITRQVYESLVSEFELLRTTSGVAPELAELARQVEARRRQNQTRLIAYLDERRLLRHGLSFEEAVDVLWTLTSYDLYRMLVVERRWDSDHYESWLAKLLIQNLLESADV